MDGRKYKGKQTAANNYRMVARAGTRVFIWSKTGYSPQSLTTEQLALLQAIPAMLEAIAQLQTQNQEHVRAIAQLQSQIQTLLPPSADFIPPGWDAEVWRKLPAPDKGHFRYLFRRRRFRPSQQRNNKPLALPAVTVELLQQQQKDELQRLVGETSPEEKQQLEATKFDVLREFWSQAPEEDQRNMPF